MFSQVKQLGAVSFPAFMPQRVYMQEFFQQQGLPKHLERWQDTVDAMLGSIKTSLPIYLMIDAAEVKACSMHRREGLHVDGYWLAGLGRNRHGRVSAHGVGGHGSSPSPRHGHGSSRHGSGVFKETLLLSSDVLGCVGYEGEFEHPEWKEGDRSSLNPAQFNKVVFEPGYVYGGDTMEMLHESIPMIKDCQRTVVRLNVPGVSLWENMH